MSYRSLNAIASDLQALCSGLGVFNTMRKATCSSHGQVLSVIETIGHLPACVICVGPMRYSDGMAFRTVDAAIVLLLPFEDSERTETLQSLAILDNVVSLFEPEASLREIKTMNGVSYAVTDIEPIVISDASCAAYAVALEIKCPVTLTQNP